MMFHSFIFRTLTLSIAMILALGYAQGTLAQTVSVLVAYHSATGNTEKMAQGVAEGAKSVAGANVTVKRVGEVTADDLLSSDGVIIGSPVYFGNMSGEVKSFLDSWFKMGLFQDRKMRNKVGGTFATGGGFSNGKELTMLTIQAAMVMHQMLVTSGGGGFGATATTGPDSPGVDEKELAEANALGKRIAEVATLVKRGGGK
jgi:NAD(P)H dehydrogenase (quinone)